MIAHLWRLSFSFMLSLLGFIFSIGLAFEIVRIIILVFEIIKDLFERVSLYHCDSWKLYIKLQMISFVFTDYDYYYSDYLQRLHFVCLVVNPNTLGGKPRVYGETNLGGKPRLSCINRILTGDNLRFRSFDFVD